MKMVFKWLNRIVSFVLIVLLVTVGSLVVMTKLKGGEPEIFGYQIKMVLSGSMEPGIKTGSIIVVKTLEGEEKNNLQVGDVITFMEVDEKIVTHRIIEVNETAEGPIYTTQGDNNNAPDLEPVLPANVLAEYTGITIPYAGYIANFAQSPNGALAFLVLPGVLMVGYSLFTIYMAIRRLEIDTKKTETIDSN